MIIWCHKRLWKKVGNLQLWWILDLLYLLILLHVLDRLRLCPWGLRQQAWQWWGVSVLVLQGRLHWEILWQDIQQLWPEWAVPVLPPARCLQPQWHSKVSLCGTVRGTLLLYRTLCTLYRHPCARCVCLLGAQDCLSNSATLLVINLACLRTALPVSLLCLCFQGASAWMDTKGMGSPASPLTCAVSQNGEVVHRM